MTAPTPRARCYRGGVQPHGMLLVLCASGCRAVFGIEDPLLLDAPSDIAADAGPCVGHADCQSGACLSDGSCADPAQIAWVAAGGTNNATCARLAPCDTVKAALATVKPYVRLTTALAEDVVIDRGVTIFGDPGSQVRQLAGTAVVEIQSTADVAIYDVAIRCTTAIGISQLATSTLTVERCKIDGCAPGIAYTGPLSVSRSIIENNPGGGISIFSGSPLVSITNSFIVHNGSTTAAFGAVSLGTPPAGSRFEFNTVVDNAADSGGAAAGGVSCASGLELRHDIIARNALGADVNDAIANVAGACGSTQSYVSADLVPLKFVAPDAGLPDYHLTAGSSAIDRPITTSVAVDFDGDPRPIGMGYDIGADEYRP